MFGLSCRGLSREPADDNVWVIIIIGGTQDDRKSVCAAFGDWALLKWKVIISRIESREKLLSINFYFIFSFICNCMTSLYATLYENIPYYFNTHFGNVPL